VGDVANLKPEISTRRSLINPTDIVFVPTSRRRPEVERDRKGYDSFIRVQILSFVSWLTILSIATWRNERADCWVMPPRSFCFEYQPPAKASTIRGRLTAVM